MEIKKVGKGLVKSVLLPVVGIAGLSLLFNYTSVREATYETSDKRSFAKLDGLIGRTILEEDKNTGEITIQRKRLITYQTLKVEKGNKYVSEFKDKKRTYFREVDGLAHKNDFLAADKDSREQIKRFKPLMNR